MKRFLLALLLIALPLVAQDEKKVEAQAKPSPPNVQRLFLLKYADPDNLGNLLRVFRANIIPNRDMRALAVDASAESMAAIEDAIKRLDIPAAAPTNVDMTVYLLVGNEGEIPAGSPALPKDLDGVVTQLKNAFAFKAYNLLDVLTLRTRTGQQASTTSSGGAIQFPGGGSQPVTTSFAIRSASIGSDGSTVRIDGMKSDSRVPMASGGGNQFSYQNLGISTDIDIREGQKVVVGRLGISKDQALFLVMTVKIVP
jgi:hypothetical protein